MDSPPKLSGETLIVHHIPLVHCQVSGGRQGSCGGSLKRSNPFIPPENLGLSRTTSLPERDVIQREALVYSSLIQTSARGEGGVGAGRGGSTASDDSSYTSSNSEDQPIMAHTLPRVKPRNRGNPLRHNPFLLNTEDDEDEEEEDGDNLNGYLEDSSFHLHGDTNSALNNGVPPFHLHDLGFPPEPFMLHGTLGKAWASGSRESLRGMASDLSAHLENLDLLGLDSQRRHGSSGSNMSMDCGEQEWGEDEEDEEEDHPMRGGGSSKTGSSSSSSSAQRCSCCGLSQTYPQHFPEAFPEPFSECHQGYTSDSSCNSSDGVLVNFSAIYNKMNNGVPAKAPPGPTANLNSSAEHSCISSVVSEPAGEREGCNGGGGAFYLDLQTSPTEPRQPQPAPCLGNTLPVFLQEPLSSPASTTTASCTCSVEHQGGLDLDANCNTYQNHHSGSAGDLASCLQSQARLVVATQNYYKLVTCDLSSQSSPSPAGSSVTSCSDEQSKGSPTPTQPTEYYLFRHQAAGKGVEEEEEEEDDRESSRRDNDEDEEEEEEEEEEERKTKQQMDIAGTDPAPSRIEGQVYVNISPPSGSRGAIGGGASVGRPRSRSYDRNLDKSPSPRLGSLERMLSCPVRLSEGTAHSPPPPPRVTSFAEIARCKRRNGGSPLLRMGTDPFSSTHSAHSHSSADFSPILEQHGQGHSHSLPPVPFTRCYSQGSVDRQSPGGGTRETRDRTEGGLSTSSDGRPAVVRYSKDQRPTTLPIQPFTFHHQFSKPQPKTLLPLLTGYVSGMQARAGSGGSGGQEGDEEEYIPQDRPHCLGTTAAAVAPPGSVRPSPLGSYSPVRLQGAPSSGTCSTCTPSPQPPRSLSCPLSADLLASHTPPTQTEASAPLPPTPPPPALGVKRGMVPPTLPTVQGHCYYRGSLPALPALPSDILSLVGQEDTSVQGPGARQHHGQSVKQLQQYYSDFLPDYFSLTERPPEEFCLSPDASTSSSSSTTTHSEISVDLQQKRGLVKAINTAVDLIVAHFGTSRDPDVKAKLGNSWVSPNVGHLILKYLCPALREVLQDGLKAYVLDLIIGQRRNQPWSLVEASTQLGPSTRMLHNLFSKVSQYSELTSHSMRLNAFIFGLLNLRSLEFWFNHLYTHEDILAVHYHPWGFLPLSQGPCQLLFEELLLLLQPLSLLPFDLDLLFEPRLFQKGQEQLRRKEQLCSAGQGLNQSTRSTFQLMRGWSTTVAESMREGVESGAGRKERAELRREGTWPRMENMGLRKEGTGPKLGLRKDAAGMDSTGNTLERNQPMMEEGLANLWRERGAAGQRLKGVGGENHQEGADREEDEKKERERDSAKEGRQRQERQAGWWYQLMQSSQVYIDQSAEGSKFAKSEKRKKSLERRQSQLPPTREGVVEGAESSQEGEGLRERSRKSSSSSDSAVSRGRPSWMGSPPDSVLSQEKEKVQGPPAAHPAGAQPQDEAPSQGMRWGRLFGSSLGSPSRSEAAEVRQAKSQRSRLPSGWLSLDRSVLDFVAQTVGVGSGKRVEPSAPPLESLPTSPPPPSAQVAETKSPCEVKALCHHIATEPGQLSFHKGDVLRVLGRADSDWLLCSLGAIQGLVPIIYVTLRSLDDNQGPGDGGPH